MVKITKWGRGRDVLQCFSTFIILSFFSSIGYADFEDLGVGARSFGMGNAFSALANDASAIYYNPAGLTNIKNAQIMTAYDRLYLGLSDKSILGDGFVSVVSPLDEVTGIGISYVNFHLVNYYQEHTFVLSYGNKIFSQLSAGINVKGLSRGLSEDIYTKVDPLFLEKGYTKTNFSFDTGLLYRPFPSYSFALTAYNINQPDLGLKDKDIVPMSLKLGFAYRYHASDFVVDFAYTNKDWDVYFGTENWFFERCFALRGGVKTGSRADNDLSVGIGYNSGNIQFDYAVQYPLSGIKNTFGSHRISFGVKFGDVLPESDDEFGYIPMVPKEEIEKIQKEAEESAQMVQKLKEEIENYKKNLEALSAENEKNKEKEAEELTKKIEQYNKEMTKALKSEVDAREKLNKITVKNTTSIKVDKNTYVVEKGDTLKSIAIKLYNDESRWVSIYNLNKDRIKQGIVESGQILILPEERK
ncbi:MAG: hypothetical protein AABY84_01865 [Candidatus Firestonebacteria bacterium]